MSRAWDGLMAGGAQDKSLFKVNKVRALVMFTLCGARGHPSGAALATWVGAAGTCQAAWRCRPCRQSPHGPLPSRSPRDTPAGDGGSEPPPRNSSCSGGGGGAAILKAGK
eukprot:gene24638-biopygen23910